MSSAQESGRGRFDRFATATNGIVSSPAWFFFSVVMVVVWAAWGPFAHYSSRWQLVINTGTTILTFLLVGLAANTASRNSRALHKKLDAIAAGLEDLMQGHDPEQMQDDAEQLRDSVGLEEKT